MRKATIHLYYMDSLLTLKMSWQNFISSFENTLLLVWTAKKTTLMIKTNQQMPESTLAVARWRISSCVGSEDEKAETNPSLSKCWNSFFWKQPRSEPHRLFNQTRKLSNVPNCLFSSSHPPPHVRARETMAQQLGRSAKAMLLGQLATSTQYDESTPLILNHISLLPKGKVCGAQQMLLHQDSSPQAWGMKVHLEPWQLMMPVPMGGWVHETRQYNHRGFWPGSFLLFGELWQLYASSISDETPLLFLYCRIVLFLIK